MLRTLLVQQFALRAEHEVRERLVFVLKRRESHGQLRPSRGCGPTRQPCGFRVGPGRLEGTAVTFDALAATLSTALGRPIVIDGSASEPFDLLVSWNAAAADPVAALIEALNRQLGLTAVSGMRGVPVLVIRSARPAI
jgi:uncharacterized protein (TIGR03435 family)